MKRLVLIALLLLTSPAWAAPINDAAANAFVKIRIPFHYGANRDAEVPTVFWAKPDSKAVLIFLPGGNGSFGLSAQPAPSGIWVCPSARRRAHRRGRCLSSKQPDTQGENGSVTAPTMPRVLRLRMAVRVRPDRPRRGDAATNKPDREGNFHKTSHKLIADRFWVWGYRSGGTVSAWRKRWFEFPMHSPHARPSLPS